MKRSLEEERLRLIGIELRYFDDGATLATTPSGRLYRIENDPTTVDQLLQTCDGSRPVSDILADSKDADGVSEILQVLTEDGCLRCTPPIPHERDWIRFGSNGHLDPRQIKETEMILIGDALLGEISDEQWHAAGFASVETATYDALLQNNAGRDFSKAIVIALRECFDHDFLMALNDFCGHHNIRWTQLHLDNGRGWLGPAVVPGSTADYRDLMGRRLSSAENIDVFRAAIKPNLQKKRYAPPQEELLWMLSFLIADVKRWITGAPFHLLNNEIEADPLAFTFTPHPVLPLPDRPTDGRYPPNYLKSGMDLVLDDRTGIVSFVQQIEHHPAIPKNLTTAQSHVADMRRLYIWGNNQICGGSTFGDFEAARKASIGEGLERYCGNWIQTTKVTKTSYQELQARGEYAIDPEKLILYSQEQYRAPGFPFVPFTHDLQVHWVQGYSLTKERPAWIPGSLVYVNWYKGPFENDPPTNFLYYPGIQAGPSLEFALTSALEEIVERHATMVWWTNRQPLPAVKLPAEFQALWEGQPTQQGQRAWLIHLDNEFDIPVMAAVVENTKEKLFNIGFATRPTPVEAAYKAWTEALTLQEGSRDLLNPNGLFRQAAAKGLVGAQFMKPWRPDRAYLEDYLDDFRDVNDLMCQQQVFLDPRAREYVRPWVDVEAVRTFDELPQISERASAAYRQPLEDQDYEIFYVDITTPDVAMAGISVVRVVVPGLVPNFPAAFPCLGNGRIQRAAVELGWRATPLAEEELNYFPMPHA